MLNENRGIKLINILIWHVVEKEHLLFSFDFTQSIIFDNLQYKVSLFVFL